MLHPCGIGACLGLLLPGLVLLSTTSTKGEEGASDPRARQRSVESTARTPKDPLGDEKPNEVPWLDDPGCGTMKYFGDAMAAWADALRLAYLRLGDVILPDVGVAYDTTKALAPVLSWSLAFAFGPTTARRVTHSHCGGDDVEEFQAFRFAPELGVTFSDPRTGWMRVGFGTVLHAKHSKVGLIAGIGPTFTWRDDHIHIMLSPELGMRLGTCCRPGYWIITARYEHGVINYAPPSVLVKLGLSYW